MLAQVLINEDGINARAISQQVSLPEFDTHVLKRVLREESNLHDPRPLTDAQIDADVDAYLEFLRERKLNHGVNIVPVVQVDRVWHIHIIQTEQYAQVCNDYFGYFLHHASFICGMGDGKKMVPWHTRQ